MINMEFSYKPINPFQDDGLSKEDRAMINGMRETAYICGKRGGDVEFAVHQALKRMGRYDLLPPCEKVRKDWVEDFLVKFKEIESEDDLQA